MVGSPRESSYSGVWLIGPHALSDPFVQQAFILSAMRCFCTDGVTDLAVYRLDHSPQRFQHICSKRV